MASHTWVSVSVMVRTLVSFYSRSAKQKLVTLSSTESETYSATEAAKDVYFRNVLQELGFPTAKPTSIKVDNQSLIALATNVSGNHKRVRHFLSRIHYLIEQFDGKVITLDYVDTKFNTADQLTKPLSVLMGCSDSEVFDMNTKHYDF